MCKLNFFLIFLFFLGCRQEAAKYLHGNSHAPDRQFINQETLVDDLFPSIDGVTILFVIDNSGSMSQIQKNIIANTELFINQFSGYDHIDWKIGLLSTDIDDQPYIGFNTDLNSNTFDPVEKFQKAVKSLGVYGDGSEKLFGSMKKHLNLFPSWGKESHIFAVIMVTDEIEQSGISHSDLLKFTRNQVDIDTQIRYYGVLSTVKDCGHLDWKFRYTGSSFEKIIDETNGFMIPSCDPDFGNKLAEIGRDLMRMTDIPRIMLKDKPRLETLKVYFKGKELNGGLKKPNSPQEQFGYWYYDDYLNTVNFFSLEFLKGQSGEKIRIDYEIDDGYNRDWER